MTIHGILPATVGLAAYYFDERWIFLDCRGTLVIDEGSHWGWHIFVYTQTHSIADGYFKSIIYDAPVIVESGAWICSGAILSNCRIGKNAIVSLGSVVNNMVVPEHTIVAGNPARVVAKWNENRWEYDREYRRLLNQFEQQGE
jgi:acetyltransferase-like isoleucine patch superfamily enzyme